MAPYLVLLFLSGVTGFFLCELKKSKGRDLLLLALVTVAMCTMASLRAASVGVDYQPYVDYFQGMCEQDASFLFSEANGYRKEVGYTLLNFVVSRFTQNSFVFMGISSSLIIILRSIAIYRFSSSVWVSVFVYISFGFFGYSLCTVRQEMAISVAFLALSFLQNKKILPYMALIILAGTFHKSLYLLIPIYFVANLPLNKIILSVYGAGTLLVLLFSEEIIDFTGKYIYESYQPGSYYMRGRNYSTAFIPVVLFFVALIMKKALLKRNPKNIVLLNFSCYAAALFVITLKNFIFQRVALIFLPAALFLIPEMINALAVDESKYAELQKENMDRTKKKQSLQKLGALREQRKSELTLYYTSMGLILAGCILYFLFLLVANRLLIVPYVTFFNH